jgi:hypothetical protein
MTNIIICEACGRKGIAGNLYVNHRTDKHVFRHLGHDTYDGNMRYTCLYCGAVLAVDPMGMLNNFFIKGIPCNSAGAISGTLKNKGTSPSGQLLKDAFKGISGS